AGGGRMARPSRSRMATRHYRRRRGCVRARRGATAGFGRGAPYV
ncbi:MAG: hypothetical protein AVDCRST_MAG49-1958, partial [uncultured Thermomicrobiales bacterium]